MPKKGITLPKHVQQSPKKSQKRYIKYRYGSPKTQAKMLKKASKRVRRR